MRAHAEHRQLCTIELIAAGHAGRCPGEECAFWDHGCALTRIEYELEGRPDVAQLLVDLRRELEGGRMIDVEEVHSRFAHILNEDEGILEPEPRPRAGDDDRPGRATEQRDEPSSLTSPQAK